MNRYSYAVDHSERYGTLITLRVSGLGQNDYRAVCIAPERGANMIRMTVNGYDLLGYDLEDLNRTAFTGCPILYPTPNRVRDSHYTFGGRMIHQRKKGMDRNIHGLVYDEPWHYDEPVVSEDRVSVLTWYDFEPGTENYESFPFKHRVYVRYELTDNEVSLNYTVENFSQDVLPYGFAIHPFWMKLGGREGTCLQVNTPRVCERTPDCLPTGRILPVDGTRFDLRKLESVKTLDIDDVFSDMGGQSAVIDFKPLGIAMELSGSEEFTHMVVCTSPDSPLLCVENQTCMTDAHNMYARGLREESGLLTVEPGKSRSGAIYMRIKES